MEVVAVALKMGTLSGVWGLWASVWWGGGSCPWS